MSEVGVAELLNRPAGPAAADRAAAAGTRSGTELEESESEESDYSDGYACEFEEGEGEAEASEGRNAEIQEPPCLTGLQQRLLGQRFWHRIRRPRSRDFRERDRQQRQRRHEHRRCDQQRRPRSHEHREHDERDQSERSTKPSLKIDGVERAMCT